MNHGDVSLAGPLWFVAQFLVLGALVLAVYVMADSLRAPRRAFAAANLREPIWLYTVLVSAYLLVALVVQLDSGIQGAAAIVAGATPFAIAVSVTYLLRVVFPRPRAEE